MGAPVISPVGVLTPAVTIRVLEGFQKAGYVPNVEHETQSVAESLGLAREGFGITFIKTSDLPLVDEALKVLSFAEPLPVETGMFYIRERRCDSLRDFVALVTEHFRTNAAPGQLRDNILFYWSPTGGSSEAPRALRLGRLLKNKGG